MEHGDRLGEPSGAVAPRRSLHAALRRVPLALEGARYLAWTARHLIFGRGALIALPLIALTIAGFAYLWTQRPEWRDVLPWWALGAAAALFILSVLAYLRARLSHNEARRSQALGFIGQAVADNRHEAQVALETLGRDLGQRLSDGLAMTRASARDDLEDWALSAGDRIERLEDEVRQATDRMQDETTVQARQSARAMQDALGIVMDRFAAAESDAQATQDQMTAIEARFGALMADVESRIARLAGVASGATQAAEQSAQRIEQALEARIADIGDAVLAIRGEMADAGALRDQLEGRIAALNAGIEDRIAAASVQTTQFRGEIEDRLALVSEQAAIVREELADALARRDEDNHQRIADLQDAMAASADRAAANQDGLVAMAERLAAIADSSSVDARFAAVDRRLAAFDDAAEKLETIGDRVTAVSELLTAEREQAAAESAAEFAALGRRVETLDAALSAAAGEARSVAREAVAELAEKLAAAEIQTAAKLTALESQASSSAHLLEHKAAVEALGAELGVAVGEIHQRVAELAAQIAEAETAARDAAGEAARQSAGAVEERVGLSLAEAGERLDAFAAKLQAKDAAEAASAAGAESRAAELQRAIEASRADLAGTVESVQQRIAELAAQMAETENAARNAADEAARQSAGAVEERVGASLADAGQRLDAFAAKLQANETEKAAEALKAAADAETRTEALTRAIEAARAELAAEVKRFEVIAAEQKRLGGIVDSLSERVSVNGEDNTRQIADARRQVQQLNASVEETGRVISRLGGANAVAAQPFARLLDKTKLKRIESHWTRQLGLSLQPTALSYLAYQICKVEDRCAGRFAGPIETALMRLLALRSLPHGQVDVLEIGAGFGIGAGMLHRLAGRGFSRVRLTLVDALDGAYSGGAVDPVSGETVDRATLERNMAALGVPHEDWRLIQHRSSSREALMGARDRQYDLVVIDGDHSVPGVAFDFEAYGPLVKPGGLLIFADYGSEQWPGVQPFVDDYARPRGEWAWIGGEYRNAILRRRPADGEAAAPAPAADDAAASNVSPLFAEKRRATDA